MYIESLGELKQKVNDAGADIPEFSLYQATDQQSFQTTALDAAQPKRKVGNI